MKYLKTYNESLLKTKFKQFFNAELTFEDYWDKVGGTFAHKHLLDLACEGEKITSLKGIEKFQKLYRFDCSVNKLTSLKGIEQCTSLEQLYCQYNNLKNLDEIKLLPNLRILYSFGNPFEEPIPIEIVNKFGRDEIYGNIKNEICVHFGNYKYQKMFLTKYPERVKDLEPFGYHPEIKKEFPSLIVGKEWGFFDLEGGSK